MDEQLTLLLVLAVAVIGLLAFAVLRDRAAQDMADALARQSRESAERNARTTAELIDALKESNTVLRGFADVSQERFFAYDPAARDMKRMELESKALEMQLSDTRTRYRNGAVPAGTNGTAGHATKTAERFSDTGDGTL